MDLCILERSWLAARQLLVQEQLREAFRDRTHYTVVIALFMPAAAGRRQPAQQHVQNRQRGFLDGRGVAICFGGAVQQLQVQLV